VCALELIQHLVPLVFGLQLRVNAGAKKEFRIFQLGFGH
jgi:hypothetical protein